MLILIVFAIASVVINVLFGLLERILAKKANRTYGLVMPFFFFLIATMSILSSIEKTFSQLLNVSAPLVAVALWIVLYVFLNIPTLVTYIVYYRTRRKMGESPWPSKKHL